MDSLVNSTPALLAITMSSSISMNAVKRITMYIHVIELMRKGERAKIAIIDINHSL